MKLRTDPRRRRERGTQIAEFAVALPLLVFLVLLVTEGAQFIRAHEVLNNIAREGARLASQPENQPCIDNPTTCFNGSDQTAAIVTAMSNYASYNGMTFPTLTEYGGSDTASACYDPLATVFLPHCYSWHGTAPAGSSWSCTSLTITINQGKTVNLLTPPGTITTSNVQVSCNWALVSLPRWSGAATTTVKLIGTAEFRNLW